MPALPYIQVSVNNVGPTGVAGTQVIDPGSADVISCCVFQIANQSSLSAIPRLTVVGASALKQGPGVPLVTGQNVQYLNLLTGAISAAGTAITANGIYALNCPGCQVELITSAGSADCYPVHLPGKAI